jgi:L-methionine (R)-S-oxide reductase
MIFLTNLYKIKQSHLNTFTKKTATMTFEDLKPKVTEITSNSAISRETKLLEICQLLSDSIDYYNWVGFYFANPETKTLHLGPYVGAETDHTVIPFGKGICGQVAVSNANFVVPDVAAQDNYIACSFTVKSEIVVPLFVNGKNIGQIDIDSHVLNPFTEADERFLEFVNEEIAKLY